MRKRFLFHSNAVWPPATLVIPFVVIYGLLTGSIWLIAKGSSIRAAAISDMQEFTNLRTTILCGAAFVYALLRIWRFHPKCNQAYAAWLKLSPWTAAKPLPLGPVHLVWQDAAVIGALTLIAWWHRNSDPALPAEIFGLVYLSFLTILLPFLRQWPATVALGFLWPALGLPGLNMATVWGIFVAISVAVWYGHWKSLRAFPWDTGTSVFKPGTTLLQTEIQIEVASVSAPANVGWPFTVLAPKIRCLPVPSRTAFWLSALFGWWTFCFIKGLRMEPFPELMLATAIPLGLVRFVIYCSGLVPPFNLWGRFASGRLLLPGYDKVFLTPLAAVLISIVGAILIRRCGDWYPAAESVGVALIWFVSFNGGPTKKNWILTGHHRFRMATQARSRQAMREV